MAAGSLSLGGGGEEEEEDEVGMGERGGVDEVVV